MTDHSPRQLGRKPRPCSLLVGLTALACMMVVGCKQETATSPGSSQGELARDDDTASNRRGDARTEDSENASRQTSSADSKPRGASSGENSVPAPSNRDAESVHGGAASDNANSTPSSIADSSNDDPTSPKAGAPGPKGGVTGASSQPAPPPAEVHPPEVILSQHHAQTCVVKVGDAFPAMTLPDREGTPQDLAQLRGDRMTVVVFWNARNPYAREQFSRIMREIHNNYQEFGVSVVAINVGDSPDVVAELAAQHEVTVPCLLDADGQAFQQAATDLLPRTYLLDAEGRVLWFDLEYSRGQRQGLHNAVHFHLQQHNL